MYKVRKVPQIINLCPQTTGHHTAKKIKNDFPLENTSRLTTCIKEKIDDCGSPQTSA